MSTQVRDDPTMTDDQVVATITQNCLDLGISRENALKMANRAIANRTALGR
jgi:hypothetical protein